MNLTIVYHVYKNSNSLEESLRSIFEQTDTNFEFTLVNDGATSNVTNILKKFDFSKLKKFVYYK
jgi:glycosyltransferase involved in cell wall biosynthesis